MEGEAEPSTTGTFRPAKGFHFFSNCTRVIAENETAHTHTHTRARSQGVYLTVAAVLVSNLLITEK